MTKNELPLSKEEILDAAEQVLRRYGPDKTSVVDIAKVLQVSHGTLYRHFESKAALREAVTSRWLHTSIAIPLEAIASENDGSAAERLRLWLETLIQTKQKFAVEDAGKTNRSCSTTARKARPRPPISSWSSPTRRRCRTARCWCGTTSSAWTPTCAAA